MSQTVFGAEATVIYLNRAFNNSNPTSAAFQNQVRAAGTTDASQYAFAAQFGQGASVASFSEAALAEKFLTNLGILPSTNAAITAFTAELASYLTGISVADRGIVGLQLGQILATLEGATAPELAPFATAAVAWNEEITTSWLAVTGNTPVVPGFELGTGRDNLLGTTGDDTFTAHIIDNANTLQSGDKINGGAGNDTLNADIGTSQNFAITPELTNVEAVKIRVQADQRDSGDNNIAGVGIIDAERSVGVTHWESNNSRADLIIEDVRIAANQKTSDITIAMVETDPGDVDFGVYFDQHSLRNASTGQTSLNIRLMDTGAAGNPATAATPLLNNPYDQFKIGVNGALFTIDLDKAAVAAADTYEAFLTVFNTALAPNGLVATLQGTFTITDPITNAQVTGQQIVLSGTAGVVIESMPGAGWFNTTGASVPATSNIYTTYSSNASNTTELVTSKVILDDVGRGSTGGDLVIGGLSVGDTSTSRGVERFEIEVRDNSKLQTINSTNNALREVTIVNGVTSNTVANAYTTTVADQGNLTVNGDAAQLAGLRALNNANTALPGVDNNSPVGIHHGANAAGFTDVRLIDASAFKGKLAFTADITQDSIAKYINLADVQSNPAGDVAGVGNVNFNVRGANFAYTGGSNDDTMVVNIDGAVAASRSTVVVGREDFTFNIDGGAGNDNITVTLINGANAGNAQNWYNNQDLNNNITVSGGAGNDTIRVFGAGDVKIDAGSGNDTVYTDNTGVQTINTGLVATPTTTSKAVWAFNTVDQATLLGAAPAAGAYGAAGRNINDLRSDINESYNFYNSKVFVTFKAIGTTVSVNVPGTGYKTTDLEINQAIKAAINSDAVLSKLLLAQDGPANSLLVNSLIDGALATTDLSVTLTPLTATEVGALSPVELAAAGAAYGIVAPAVPTAANVSAAMAAAYAAFTGNGDYNTALANDGTTNITGAASTSSSDNLVLPGEGNDVIVLGTTVGVDTASSSNETIVIGSSFGNDTVVNFAVGGNGFDAFDFTALNGTTLSAGYATDKSITVQLSTSLATSVTVTEKAAIETLFNAAANTVAQDHVFLSVNASNIASVYTVTDPVGTTGSVATLQGTIDLADTAWTSLTAANFVNSSAAGYNLMNGPTGSTGAVVVPGAPTTATVNVAAAGSVTETAATNTTFNVAAGGYTYNIAGFGAGDVLKFFTAAALTVTPDADQIDGVQSITAADAVSGATTTITLTGLTAAQDGALFNVASFATVFGAGTIA